MTMLKRLLSTMALLVLTACGGGGGDAGDSPFGPGSGSGGGGGTTSPVAADLVLVLSNNTISNTGTETVTATATALDGNRNTLANVPVTISVDNGATATASGATTAGNGNVAAQIGIGSDRSNRVITVTATSGSLTRTATLTVSSATGGTATATDLLLTLSAATISSSGTETVTATAMALDANRNTMAGVPVTITISNGGTVTPTGTVTGSNGTVTSVLGTGGDPTNRTMTVTATSGTLVRTAQLAVSAVGGNVTPSELVLTLSTPSIVNTGGETAVATVTALDANRNVLPGVGVTFSVDSGTVAPAGTTTGANGTLSATIGIGANQAPRTIVVTARSGSLTRTANLVVTAPGASVTASDLVLTLSSNTIANTGTPTVTATVTALDALRNTLPNVGVTIAVDSGTAQVSAPTTNAAGVVTATIGIGADRTNRDIHVTAMSGSISRTVTLRVVDVPTTGQPVAEDLSLVLSSATLDNGGSNAITATVTAVDANRNVLAGIPVTVSVSNNAIVSVSGAQTNAQGVVTATVGIGADRSNRVVTVTASSGTLTRSASFSVIGATLTASYAPTVSAGSSGVIEFTLVDTNALPMADVNYTITADQGLPPRSDKTNANGKFTYEYQAPAQSFTITATAAGATRSVPIQVSSAEPPAVGGDLTILSASVTATPSVVSVNAAGSTQNSSELRALFVGRSSTQDNVPIPNARARFVILNNDDGSLGAVTTPGGAYAISDGSGIARATYTPGARSSPTDGVTIRMCWGRDSAVLASEATCKAGFATDASHGYVDTRLTVVSEALSVNIRTNELVKIGAANLTYIKEFVVMVVDAAGQAKADVQITPSVDLTGYHKGIFVWNPITELWVQSRSLVDTEQYSWNAVLPGWQRSGPTTQPVCPNEDVNRSGTRDVGEDLNGNAELDPRKADVAIKMVGSSKTDTNGLAIVQIEYGKDLASWVDFVITVTASGISGTEARARYVGNLYGVGNLPYPANAVTDAAVAPAFVVSPYGRAATCDVAN